MQLPKSARLPINRCNLPADIIGGLTFQLHPIPLCIDSIDVLYHDLIEQLETATNREARYQAFHNYMTIRFRLPASDLPEWDLAEPQLRPRATYERLLRGWFFDSDSREGAVWKGWVESRFGLLTRYHHGPLNGPESDAYRAFMDERIRGVYNTNTLETQLDLLYTYCQYELRQRWPGRHHLCLYRGSRGKVYGHQGNHDIKFYNNLSSFTRDPEEAVRFGNKVMQTLVPLSKIICFDDLLPGQLNGEQEYMVLGGLYAVRPYTRVLSAEHY